MKQDHICLGAHDLDDGFRSLRLFDGDGEYFKQDAHISPPEVWEFEYTPCAELHPPHVEDVLVQGKAKFIESVEPEHVRELVLAYDPPWCDSTEELFDRTVEATNRGRIYIPDGKLPARSTGWWMPDVGLCLHGADDKPMFRYEGDSELTEFTWAGMSAPPKRIDAGNLVRVSLAKFWIPSSAPAGYYVQISDVY
jgi:hypothetical protein